MRAVLAPTPGGPQALVVEERPDPTPGPDDVVIDVVATAVNRADLLQRQGSYPPPPGASDILGLECSGVISAVGDRVPHLSIGDEVCALLAGGGYADKVLVPAMQVMPIPDGVSLIQAAALPEVACTVWSNVVTTAQIHSGERLLVHGGAGGIGTCAIQIGVALGAQVAVTVGSAAKAAFCAELGAHLTINYREQDFVGEAKAWGGADVILDNMGASYLSRNIAALASGGRLVTIGLQGGIKAELNFSALMAKRGSVAATTLRARSTPDKGAICADVVEFVWPLVAAGQVKPIVWESFALEDAALAHAALESGDHIGKVLLTTAV